MKDDTRSSPLPDASISVDEVGIRYAVFGDLRLRTVCQPIFAIRSGLAVPVAVNAIDAVHRNGKVLQMALAMSFLTRPQRIQCGRILRRLHLHNLQNVSEAALDLHLAINIKDAGIEQAAIEMTALMDEGSAIGVGPEQFVFDLSDMAMRDPTCFGECALALGRTGATVSLDTAAMGAVGASTDSQPRLVRIPADWFQMLCRDPASAKLLGSMTAILHRRGIKVQVEGIDSASLLRTAIEAEVDFLQGLLLGEPALAGAAFEEEPRPLSVLLRGANVLAFGRL